MFARSLFHSPKPISRQLRFLQPQTRLFHPTSANMVQVGDSIPNVEVQEGSPGNKLNIAQELATGEAIVLGVPAAFSPGCSDHHVPSYLMYPDIKKHKVYVVSVNDSFVMKAWGKNMDKDGESGIRFIADPAGDFTGALDLLWDSEPYFGNKRGKRYAMKVNDGKITKVTIEEDPSKVTTSGADAFLQD